MTADPKILVRKDSSTGWLVFNNPEKRNAMSLDMWGAAEMALEDFAKDASIRVVVLAGAGGKAFLSGADISQFKTQRSNADEAAAFAEVSASGRRRLRMMRKPTIAMIEGFCVGGGLAVAMNTDIRIASVGSVFAIPAGKLGLAYNFENLSKLVQLVGPVFAKDIMLTGRRIDAAEAHAMGLINRVVERDALQDTVTEYARMIGENAPLSVEASKFTIDQAVADRSDRDMAEVERLLRACFDSRDYAEGRAAFLEKRRPVFTGR